MKRRIALTLLCIVTALLQTAWPEALCVASIEPNLAVILTASFALMCGSRTGMLMGFWTGLWRQSWLLCADLRMDRFSGWLRIPNLL